MTRSRLTAVLIALFALAVPATASAADPLDAHQWSDLAKPRSGQPFYLYNQVNREYVGHGSRTFGPDLEWVRRPQYGGQWILLRPRVGGVTDHRGTLAPDEKVALYNTQARKYLVYKSRRTGINLDWSKTPTHEWQVEYSSAKLGASLYNTRARDFVVHGKRSYGINLQWLSDRRKAQATEDRNAVGTVHDASVTMTAQPPVQGFVPFLGSFGGGGMKAVLTKVANPSNGVRLFFIKRGRSNDDCGNADAVFTVNPGQSMTAEQMKALWLSATPSLANPVAFVACAATQASSVRINVQYRITG